MKTERTLKNLRKSLPGKIYLYFKDQKTAQQFLTDAKSEGYGFGEYGLPEIMEDSIISLKSKRQLSHVGAMGRIEFQCGGSGAQGRFHRVDYARYKRGYKYFII